MTIAAPFRGTYKLRPNYPRTKTGCLTCRHRRKKCDERRPICRGCTRNELRCLWKDPSHSRPPGPYIDQAHGRKQCVLVVADDPNQAISSAPALQPPDLVLRLPPNQLHYASDRACALTSVSLGLLSHYIIHTGALLAAAPLEHSPFITQLLPLACLDDTLMHAILATSAAHLSFKNNGEVEIDMAAWKHYSSAIQSLQRQCANLCAMDPEKTLRLLVVLIVISHFEALSGNCNGTIFMHLRACRVLIHGFLNGHIAPLTGDCKSLFGFSIEIYAYLLFSNTLTPYGMLQERTLPYDSFLMSLDVLTQYQTFGTMFAGAHGLFQLIPLLSLLHSNRLNEQEVGEVSESSILISNQLYDLILHWDLSECEDDCDGHEASRRQLAAECYRYALEICLLTAMAGTEVTDITTIYRIETLTRAIMVTVEQLSGSSYCASMLWPLMIAGSCMINYRHQNKLEEMLRNSRYQMRHTVSAAELLCLLWKEDSQHVYGPYGLSVVMKKYNMNCCLF
ncbi:hypothetical protein PV08_08797 [Exophiala spinifera]|uniref:Zn(2)-C6 fungal-type domain-containing protein n=1 Tax=Exophiala spinifera TaxID=91928 RepID=A0A0D1ZLB8_9EURO|nr:uncharacterized protein PV08_08797 [Exophiala spinifera]KIW13607.1 hypothetical protein PV08_08797 [Exophiala spinifera]